MADVHDTIREWWDRDSHTYDEAKSHAISDPLEAAAWRQALREALPEPPARVLDVGAGTKAFIVYMFGFTGAMLVNARRRPMGVHTRPMWIRTVVGFTTSTAASEPVE